MLFKSPIKGSYKEHKKKCSIQFGHDESLTLHQKWSSASDEASLTPTSGCVESLGRSSCVHHLVLDRVQLGVNLYTSAAEYLQWSMASSATSDTLSECGI